MTSTSAVRRDELSMSTNGSWEPWSEIAGKRIRKRSNRLLEVPLGPFGLRSDKPMWMETRSLTDRKPIDVPSIPLSIQMDYADDAQESD